MPSFFAAARSDSPASRRSLLTAAATEAASGSGFGSSCGGAGATALGVGCSGTGGDFLSGSEILGTADGPLYQSERWTYPGALQYDFSVPAGSYTVNLKFSENYANGPGQRVFNIVINTAVKAIAGS